MILTDEQKQSLADAINADKTRNGRRVKIEDIDFMLKEIKKDTNRKQSMFARRLESGLFPAIKYLYNLYFKNL